MVDRRGFMGLAAGAAAAASLPSSAFAAFKGRLKQGVCPNVFDPKMSFEDGVRLATRYGVKAYDFVVNPADFATVKRHGMQLSILGAELNGAYALRPQNAPAGWSAIGLKEAQGDYLQGLVRAIDAAAANGCPNVLTACGSRGRVSYSEGLDNTVEFLNMVKGRAEEKGVTICVEILNNKGQAAPPNSLFDHPAWGWEMCKRVNSRSVKVLFDIFHVQLDDGNIVASIREGFQWIGHIHTGGVPGRNEIWRNNEIDYRFIAQTLVDLKYQGFVSHEWHPSEGANVEECLKKSVALMDV